MDSLLNKPAVVSLIAPRRYRPQLPRHHQPHRGSGNAGGRPRRSTGPPWCPGPGSSRCSTIAGSSRTSRCRISSQQVFSDRGFTDFANRLTGTYPPREYCVQYRETDLNFISRLLEDEGIFYFFEHDADKHTLVLADQPTAFVDCPSQSEVAYDTTPGLWQDVDVVLVRAAHPADPGRQDHRERLRFHQAQNLHRRQSRIPVRKGEFYEYPGKYTVRDEGSRYARVRLEEQEVKLLTITAGDQLPGFPCGLQVHPDRLLSRRRQQGLRDARHPAQGRQQHLHLSANCRRRSTTATTIEAIPADTPYHPPRNARRPFIQGSQTAVVVGKSGEEIWVDQYGRVKVQFFWDRAGKMDENSSCWIRVAQLLGGQRLGRHLHAAHRPGSHRRLSGRRPGPSHHHRTRLQRRPDGSLRAAGRADQEHHQVDELERRRRV